MLEAVQHHLHLEPLHVHVHVHSVAAPPSVLHFSAFIDIWHCHIYTTVPHEPLLALRYFDGFIQQRAFIT